MWPWRFRDRQQKPADAGVGTYRAVPVGDAECLAAHNESIVAFVTANAMQIEKACGGAFTPAAESLRERVAGELPY